MLPPMGAGTPFNPAGGRGGKGGRARVVFPPPYPLTHTPGVPRDRYHTPPHPSPHADPRDTPTSRVPSTVVAALGPSPRADTCVPNPGTRATAG